MILNRFKAETIELFKAIELQKMQYEKGEKGEGIGRGECEEGKRDNFFVI